MKTGIRFSAPTLDVKDYERLSRELKLEPDKLINVIENAPLEISIIISLLQKLTERLTIKNELK